MKKRFDDDFDYVFVELEARVDHNGPTILQGDAKRLKGDDIPEGELTDKQRRQSWD